MRRSQPGKKRVSTVTWSSRARWKARARGSHSGRRAVLSKADQIERLRHGEEKVGYHHSEGSGTGFLCDWLPALVPLLGQRDKHDTNYRQRGQKKASKQRQDQSALQIYENFLGNVKLF